MVFCLFYFVIGLTIDFSLFPLVCPGRRLTPTTFAFPDRKTVVFPSRLARRVCVLSATGLDGIHFNLFPDDPSSSFHLLSRVPFHFG
jgi:hypothetical protein